MHTHGAEVQAALAALTSEARSPAMASPAARWLEALGADAPPPPVPLGFVRSREEQLALGALVRPVALAWGARRLLAQHLGTLLAHHDADAHVTLTRLVEAWPHLLVALHEAVVASLPREGPERSSALDRLAHRLAPGDPLAVLAAQALVLRDGFAAALRVRALLDAIEDDAERARSAVRVAKLRPEVDLDAEPGWVDALFPKVAQHPAALELFYPLYDVHTAEPLLRALAHVDGEPAWADLLEGLRRVDDPSVADRLDALAATLPVAPKGKRLARSQGAVRALAKHLRRARGVTPTIVLGAGVGTEGGPVVLLPEEVAAEWRGVPPGWSGPTVPLSDYDRACAASAEGVGPLAVGGGVALAFPVQALEVAELSDGAWLLVALGTVLELEAALATARAWKKTRGGLEITGSGARLLDAARTVASAGGPGSSASLPLRAGRYDVRELRTAHALAWRLAPSSPSAPRAKTSGRS